MVFYMSNNFLPVVHNEIPQTSQKNGILKDIEELFKNDVIVLGFLGGKSP